MSANARWHGDLERLQQFVEWEGGAVSPSGNSRRGEDGHASVDHGSGGDQRLRAWVRSRRRPAPRRRDSRIEAPSSPISISPRYTNTPSQSSSAASDDGSMTMMTPPPLEQQEEDEEMLVPHEELPAADAAHPMEVVAQTELASTAESQPREDLHLDDRELHQAQREEALL